LFAADAFCKKSDGWRSKIRIEQTKFHNLTFYFYLGDRMFLVRTLVLTCCLAVLALAQESAANNSYAQINLKDVASRSAEFEGRRVAITADVVSVSADLRTLDIFDNSSKTLVGVSLRQLSKSQRQVLINEPVHRVSVFGRVEMKNGRMVIKADQVMPLSVNLVAGN